MTGPMMKQGVLLKKGGFRPNWLRRRFILADGKRALGGDSAGVSISLTPWLAASLRPTLAPLPPLTPALLLPSPCQAT